MEMTNEKSESDGENANTTGLTDCAVDQTKKNNNCNMTTRRQQKQEEHREKQMGEQREQQQWEHERIENLDWTDAGSIRQPRKNTQEHEIRTTTKRKVNSERWGSKREVQYAKVRATRKQTLAWETRMIHERFVLSHSFVCDETHNMHA